MFWINESGPDMNPGEILIPLKITKRYISCTQTLNTVTLYTVVHKPLIL